MPVDLKLPKPIRLRPASCPLTLRSAIVTLPMLTLFRLLSLLPLTLLQGIGALLGSLVWAVSPATRRLTAANLAQAGYAISSWQALRENGRAAMELAWVWFRPTDTVMARVTPQGTAVIDTALAQGKGAIFLTPHMGCFEIAAQWLAARYLPQGAPAQTSAGTPITVLYRRPRKAALVPLAQASRERTNLHLASADGAGVRILLKALKRGQILGMLPDQVPGAGEGVWVPWFGRPAFTMTLPAKLAKTCQAPMLLVVAIRKPWGAGWTLHFEPFTDAISGDVIADTLAINRALERLIKLAPVQYWWSYKRYKGVAENMPDSDAA